EKRQQRLRLAACDIRLATSPEHPNLPLGRLSGFHALLSARCRASFLPTLNISFGNVFRGQSEGWIPVPGIVDAAETRFRAKLAQQSPTLAAAVAEYKRRYPHAPPRGFSAWYALAVQHAFMIIDEFDAVVEDLAPFWVHSSVHAPNHYPPSHNRTAPKFS
ncbi:hypothetical protein B0H13DRAFT_2569336, partial [Mycena leptocephala]